MHVITLKTGRNGEEIAHGLAKDQTINGWLLQHRFTPVPGKRGTWSKKVGRTVTIARVLTFRYWSDLPSF
jgi:hypothetical protein